jgi:SAM-dependent methyltransferase
MSGLNEEQRRAAGSFGADAERYDRARPRYPAGLLERIVAGSPGLDVVDAGMGTAIAARQLRALGCRVVGVEPDARMARVARGFGFTVELARFEGWDPAGRAFDAVVAGQAWHWIDPVAGAARAAEALRPGGRLAAFWNVAAYPPGLGDAFAAVFRRVLPELAHYRDGMPGPQYAGLLERTEDGIRASGAFEAPERWRVDWRRDYTRDEWLDVVPTAGDLAGVDPERLAELLAGLGAAIDAVGSAFTLPYVAVAVTARARLRS